MVISAILHRYVTQTTFTQVSWEMPTWHSWKWALNGGLDPFTLKRKEMVFPELILQPSPDIAMLSRFGRTLPCTWKSHVIRSHWAGDVPVHSHRMVTPIRVVLRAATRSQPVHPKFAWPARLWPCQIPLWLWESHTYIWLQFQLHSQTKYRTAAFYVTQHDT